MLIREPQNLWYAQKCNNKVQKFNIRLSNLMYYNSFDYPASSGFSRPDAGETTARRVSFDKIKMKIQLLKSYFYFYLI